MAPGAGLELGGGDSGTSASHVTSAVLGWGVGPDLRLHLQGSEAQFCAPCTVLTMARPFLLNFLRLRPGGSWKVEPEELWLLRDSRKASPRCGPRSKSTWEYPTAAQHSHPTHHLTPAAPTGALSHARPRSGKQCSAQKLSAANRLPSGQASAQPPPTWGRPLLPS